MQLEDFSITLDHSRYVLAMVQRFLPNSPVDGIDEATRRKYSAALPNNFIYQRADLSQSQAQVVALEAEFEFRYQVVIGCCIWTLNTLPRMQFSIRKLAKAMSCPGRVHFEAVVHLLHHISDATRQLA
jgi:hypothetical protein